MKVPLRAIDPQLRIGALVPKTLLRWFLRSASHALPPRMGRLPGCAASSVRIPRADGTMLRLLVLRPRDGGPSEGLPGMYWIHGGGYAGGWPEIDAERYRALLGCSPSVLVSPDYRWSREAPYPAAVDDCYAGLVWMKENAAALGIRTDQLFIGGSSAGGGLAVATALLARDRGEVRLAFQMPLFPMMDDRMQTASMKDNDAPMWDERATRQGWAGYLGPLFGTDAVPKYASPARETDYRGLPPAYTYVGSCDPFRDETVAYVRNLQAAGVEATVVVHEGGYHAFELVNPRARLTKAAYAGLIAAFEDAVRTRFCKQDEPSGIPPWPVPGAGP